MPLEAPLTPIADQVVALNHRFQNHSATQVLSAALKDPLLGPVALVSSFGAESVVLLHMLSVLDRHLPVIFLDTELLFPETLAYQLDLAKQLRLTQIRRITPSRQQIFRRDTENLLHLHDVDACCALRKTEPLQGALKGFDSWITGRKRFQGGARASLEFFETEADQRIKINPLAHWRPEDITAYMENNALPKHPLVAQGYGSIGCAPCTAKNHRLDANKDARSGRWPGQQKTECGIHFAAPTAMET